MQTVNVNQHAEKMLQILLIWTEQHCYARLLLYALWTVLVSYQMTVSNDRLSVYR